MTHPIPSNRYSFAEKQNNGGALQKNSGNNNNTMKTSRTSPSNMSSWIAPPRILLAVCLLLFAGSTSATITVVSTQQQFPSEPVKGVGRTMWKGYDYVGRLQYLPHHLDLCEIKEPVNVVVPKDRPGMFSECMFVFSIATKELHQRERGRERENEIL